MGLTGTYAYAIDVAKKANMQGGAEERNGKLYFKGTVATQAEANKIWDAIKTIPTWSRMSLPTFRHAAVPPPRARIP